LENEARQLYQATPKRFNAHAISDLALQHDHSVCLRKPGCSSRFCTWRITVPSQSTRSL